MIANLDVDLLKTFIAIAETGNFTRAAADVNKTQSAVSMQMKRLEDLVGRTLFVREGRQNRLTADGERMLDYARRIVRLNDEAVISFTEPDERRVIRFGTPDDYADRFLPEVLARFARTHPACLLEVECLSSSKLEDDVRHGKLDLAIVTCDDLTTAPEIIHEEPLCWVTSARHCVHENAVVPVALSQTGCAWRQMALDALDHAERAHRIAYVSTNSLAVSAAVLAGLAVAAIPEIVMRPGMRFLTEAEGFPDLGTFRIGLVRGTSPSAEVNALAQHIADSIGSFGDGMMAAE